MCPSSDFKWKTKFTIVILTKNGFQKFHTFYSKLLSKIWIFIWNLLRGTWKGFSFDVYIPSITIFIKIKQPFAWHIYFLVRHLRRYSEQQPTTSRILVLLKGQTLFGLLRPQIQHTASTSFKDSLVQSWFDKCLSCVSSCSIYLSIW